MLREGDIDIHRVWKRFAPDRKRASVADVVRHVIPGRDGRGWTWALRDVSLRASPGEAIGIVGDNGSGKSTLLQIICGVMHPNAGRVTAGGRIGALLEIRAGIHPELSGRENVQLYGALLGLSRSAVMKRFDEIVSFAEIESALDRQVKFYSSGMKTRLGFAVASFLEPEILVVDEVLAVGDAPFQQRCIDRMAEVIDAGTTVVYVSHDLPTVEATCSRALWLDRGVTRAEGPVIDVVAAYRGSFEGEAAAMREQRGMGVRATVTSRARTGEALAVHLDLESAVTGPGAVFLGITQSGADPVLAVDTVVDFEIGATALTCTLDRLPLAAGRYSVWVAVNVRGRGRVVPWQPVLHIDVAGPSLDRTPKGVRRSAPIHVEASWSVDAPDATIADPGAAARRWT